MASPRPTKVGLAAPWTPVPGDERGDIWCAGWGRAVGGPTRQSSRHCSQQSQNLPRLETRSCRPSARSRVKES